MNVSVVIINGYLAILRATQRSAQSVNHLTGTNRELGMLRKRSESRIGEIERERERGKEKEWKREIKKEGSREKREQGVKES